MTFYSVARSIVAPLARGIFRIKLEGTENIPDSGAFIICSNHRSNFDPVILGVAVKRNMFFMAKIELFKVPVLGFVVRKLGAFPVSRGRHDQQAIETAISVVKSGNILAMFPEGTRMKTSHEPGRFQSGVSRVAYKAGCSVLPAAIIANGRVRPFRRTIVRIGKLVPYEALGFTDGSAQEFHNASANLRGAIVDLMGDAK